jgi:3-deoxy-D-manno-octulosonate 8-phosphate phosphatase (KDO 8-P phosphatase)
VTDASGQIPAAILERAAAIELVVFDVDGVLTDGRVVLGDDGYEYKGFHVRDGHGIRLLQESGVPAALITGRSSTVVNRRAQDLGIRHVIQGQRDKPPALADLLERLAVAAEATAFVGDDLVDLPAMRRTGLGIAVADASPMVRAYADHVTTLGGGRGAAREVAELVMAARGTLDAALRQYLR